MSERTRFQEVQLTVRAATLCKLAAETWRISRALAVQERIAGDLPGSAAMRYAVRSMQRTFAELNIEVLDFEGQPYSPGMCMQVEYAGRTAVGESATIVETIEPTVRVGGDVVVTGRVVVAAVCQEEAAGEK